MSPLKFRRAFGLALIASFGFSPAVIADVTFSLTLPGPPPLPKFGIHFFHGKDRAAEEMDDQGFEQKISDCVNSFVADPTAHTSSGSSVTLRNNLRQFLGKVVIHQVSGKTRGGASYACGQLTINFGIDKSKYGKCSSDQYDNLFRPADAENADFCNSKGLMKIVNEDLGLIAVGINPSTKGELDRDCASLVALPQPSAPAQTPPPAQQCARPVKPVDNDFKNVVDTNGNVFQARRKIPRGMTEVPADPTSTVAGK